MTVSKRSASRIENRHRSNWTAANSAKAAAEHVVDRAFRNAAAVAAAVEVGAYVAGRLRAEAAQRQFPNAAGPAGTAPEGIADDETEQGSEPA